MKPRSLFDVHPAAFVNNFIVYNAASKYNPTTIIDVGGTGRAAKMQQCNVLSKTCQVFNANIVNGYDGAKLHEVQSKSYDVAVSVATLEHVGGDKMFTKFIDECVRVSKVATIHWFPFGKHAARTEALKKSIGHPHPCSLPSPAAVSLVCKKYAGSFSPCLSIGAHLMAIACLNKNGRLAYDKSLYNFIVKNEFLPYGYLLEVTL